MRTRSKGWIQECLQVRPICHLGLWILGLLFLPSLIASESVFQAVLNLEPFPLQDAPPVSEDSVISGFFDNRVAHAHASIPRAGEVSLVSDVRTISGQFEANAAAGWSSIVTFETSRPSDLLAEATIEIDPLQLSKSFTARTFGNRIQVETFPFSLVDYELVARVGIWITPTNVDPTQLIQSVGPVLQRNFSVSHSLSETLGPGDVREVGDNLFSTPGTYVEPVNILLGEPYRLTVIAEAWSFLFGSLVETTRIGVDLNFLWPGFTITGVYNGNAGYAVLNQTNGINAISKDGLDYRQEGCEAIPPSILVQPLSYTKPLRDHVGFSVTLHGTGPFQYQWMHDGEAIADATNAWIQIRNVSLSDAGQYSCFITTQHGSIRSDPGVLEVDDKPTNTHLTLSVDTGWSSSARLDGEPLYGPPPSYVNRFAIARYPVGRALLALPNGKTLFGGLIENSFPNRSGFVLLNADGSIDWSYGPALSATNAFSFASAFALLRDGSVWVGGLFEKADAFPYRGLVRILPNGGVDTGFRIGSGFERLDPVLGPVPGIVFALAVLQDGGILVGGNFETFDGQPNPGLVKLLPDGIRDPSFEATGMAVGSLVSCIQEMPDKSIFIGGSFLMNQNAPRFNLARISPLGRVLEGGDESFPSVNNFLFLPGGETLLATPGGVERIANIQSGLGLDSTFRCWVDITDPIFGPSPGYVTQVMEDAYGGYLITGSFDSVNGKHGGPFVRVHRDGSLDPSSDQIARIETIDLFSNNDYIPTNIFFPRIPIVNSATLVDPSTAIIAGEFTQVEGFSAHGVARISTHDRIRMLNPEYVNGHFRCVVLSRSQYFYHLQRSPSVSEPEWTEVAVGLGNDKGIFLADPNVSPSQNAFYRVEMLRNPGAP